MMVRGAADRASGFFRVAEFYGEKMDAGVLLVEAHDDNFTSGDAIEIRTGRPAGFMACDDPLTTPNVYTIDSSGHVSPSGFAVELARSDRNVRLFRIGGGLASVSIAQIDDDGLTAKRTIATTPATSKELGSFSSIKDVACADTAGGPALIPVLER